MIIYLATGLFLVDQLAFRQYFDMFGYGLVCLLSKCSATALLGVMAF